MRHFIRIAGELYQVRPLTRPTTENPSVKVVIIRTAQIARVDATTIITDY